MKGATTRALVGAVVLATLPTLASADPAGAPPPARPIDLFDIGAPSFTSFSTRDGVPESVTLAIQTDGEGFVWLASPRGLSRYDGHRWTAVEDPALDGLVFDLTVDHDGVLWAPITDRGLAHTEGGRWVLENRASGLPSDRFRRVLETTDAAGKPRLWAVGLDSLLMRREGDRWVTEPGTEGLPRGPFLSVAETHHLGGGERLWVGTFNEGVWYREDGVWHQLRTDRFDPSQVESLLRIEESGHEQLWISTFGSGLWRLDESGLRSWRAETGDLLTDELYGMAETRLPNGEHTVWVASRSGLVRVHGDRAQVFDRRHGLPSNAVRGVGAWRSPDGTEVLWVATEAGVARTLVGASEWHTASLMGSGASGVFSVLIEPDGGGGERLWLASSADGIGLYQSGRWRSFTQANGALPDSDGRLVARVANEHGGDDLLVGLRQGYLLRARPDLTFETLETPWERHPGQAVMAVLSRRVGGVYERWVATRQSGAWRWREGRWTAFRPLGAVGQWRLVNLAEQVDGRGKSWLWSGSNLGLARFDGTAWVLFGKEIGLPEVELRGITLLPDSAGRQVLWGGTVEHGVARIDVTDPEHPVAITSPALPPPPLPTTYAPVRDAAGRIYVCTNDGVQLLTPLPGGGYASRVFTRRDGMVHEECNTNSQRIDAHGRFWTGTLGGLTVYDPEGEVADRQAKPLRLTGLSVDGAANAGATLRVPPGARDVRVSYALLSWRREGESRFRTQLLGYEKEPGEWTAQTFRSLGALPPGHYTLRVEGRDYAGNQSPPIEVPIEVVPAWWQTLGARVALSAAVGLLAWALLRWRTRSLRLQRGRLAEQVAERTAELNRANARLLSLSYEDALTGLANRRRLLEALEERAAAGDPLTSLIFVDVDHFKAFNDRFGHPAGDEALRAVADVLRTCLPETTLSARYGGEEFASLLTFDGGDGGLASGLEAARALAENVRAAVEARSVQVPGTDVFNRVTISAGVAAAALTSPADAHRLLRAADTALYQAKHDGRNCVRG